MELIDIPTEQTTAATDFVLAVLAAVCVLYLYRIGRPDVFRRNVWSWVFGLLALGAAFGAVVHGFKMSAEVNNLLWQPLNLSLGLAVALFAVGAVYDMLGRRIAQRVLPIMITVGAVFYGVTVVFPDSVFRARRVLHAGDPRPARGRRTDCRRDTYHHRSRRRSGDRNSPLHFHLAVRPQRYFSFDPDARSHRAGSRPPRGHVRKRESSLCG